MFSLDPRLIRGPDNQPPRIMAPQYTLLDALHISAEIRFGILRRLVKGHSHKYGDLCLLGYLGILCSREGREVWRMNDLRVG